MNSKDPPSDPATASRAPRHSGRRAARNLVALGSAAVLAVYAAGFFRTAPAARRLATDGRKRPVAPDVMTVREVATAPAALPPARRAAVIESAPSASAAPAASTALPSTAPAFAAPVALSTFTVAASALVTTPDPVASAPLAAGPVAMPAAAPMAAKAKYKDGTFYGWGSCRHGDLQASVAIKDGRIVAAAISECNTRYSQSVIAMLPAQVVARQGPDVDSIAGASQSSDAFYSAVVEALKQAK